ncbi:MBOAT family protein [Dictyocaulus viviparus]|uniref:Protein-serine O-palmitoleoyltransferase porcupine n=1 Tax=Dictyocaulus viviparus TaxID=29172 RepID=A0A0D8YA41_DICVI|nr:MBOAT family protein [Dictyocaulus viviparus]
MDSSDIIYWSSTEQMFLDDDYYFPEIHEEQRWGNFYQVFELLNISLGILVFFEWVPGDMLRVSVMFGNVLLVLLLLLTLPYKGFMIMFTSMVLNLHMQYIVSAVDFVAIRGILMIFSMKISSLAFDRADDFTFSDIIPALAFIFNPSTMVFGPFHVYSDFLKSMERRTVRDEISSVASSFLMLIIGLFFLTYSSCLGIILPHGSLLTDYVVAQSFRSSHFFVCMISQALSTLSGMRLSVCSPLKIEFPRSLVDVVVAWNVPMHRFLHSYVYRKFAFLGNTGSIFASFAVSSLLHGFNFQITAVLFSLGFICYFENKARNQIASRFSMCVRARLCNNCKHEKRSNNWQAMILNASFSLIAVYLLTYLGAPFNEDGAEAGYDMYHTVATWRRLGFSGHWISIGIALLSLCI